MRVSSVSFYNVWLEKMPDQHRTTKACWMLIHLATNAEWRGKCKEELEAVFSRHLSSSASSATINEKLAAIPVSAWEDELPTLDACTRESQRMTLTGFALRRNLHGEMKIDGRVVRRGDFLGYSLRDVHLNPGHYPDPNKYDPGRWLRPDPVSSTVYPFVGWGAGRHPCSGMRMAKLEMKLILVMFLTRYEYELVDEDGKLPDPLPYPNKNNIHQVCLELRTFRRGAHAISCYVCQGSSCRTYLLPRLQESS